MLEYQIFGFPMVCKYMMKWLVSYAFSILHICTRNSRESNFVVCLLKKLTLSDSRLPTHGVSKGTKPIELGILVFSAVCNLMLNELKQNINDRKFSEQLEMYSWNCIWSWISWGNYWELCSFEHARRWALIFVGFSGLTHVTSACAGTSSEHSTHLPELTTAYTARATNPSYR
jgi:hypothetical protein